MLLSKSCIYGMRAALYLAGNDTDTYVSIRNMSEKLDISFHFLTKILQQLTSADLMESLKGPKGGIRLAKRPDQIFLIDIVLAIDGEDLFTKCALGLPGCGYEKPCPLHDKWAITREKIERMLATTHLKEMAVKGKAGNLRITSNGAFEWS